LVLLVRHGRTPTTGKLLPGRAPGLHLADEGRAQAEAVAERLSALGKVDAIYASPLERTRETAAPIARRLGLRVRTDRGLLDCDAGDWTGAELKQLSKRPEWRTVQRWPSGFRFPNGESLLEMHDRVASTVAQLRDRHAGTTIVVVSHADPIKAVVADALGAPFDLFQRIVISPCSVTPIAYGPAGPAVLGTNHLGSLAELRAS
jgi:probable phosphoglycerate mutase